MFANQVFSWQMAGQFVLLIGALVLMPLIVQLVAPGFAGQPERLQLTAALSCITFPYLTARPLCLQIATKCDQARPRSTTLPAEGYRPLDLPDL